MLVILAKAGPQPLTPNMPCISRRPFTGDKYDAFWLAQIHFLTGHYSRALRLLLSPLRSSQPPSASDKGKARADDSDLLYSSDEEEEMGAMGYGGGDWAQGLGRAEHKPADDESGRRLIDTNLACRHLAAQCQVRRVASTLAVWPSR